MINLNIIPTRSLNGQNLWFADYTGLYDSALNTGGYNTPNTPIASVTATRFLLSSYLLQQGAQSGITEIVPTVEYLVGGTGSFTYDTKTYNTGDTFISMISGTPTLGTCTLSQTGNVSPVIGFLPTDVQTNPLTPSSFTINNLVFPDSTYTFLYEIYTTKYTNGNSVPAGTYIAGGNVGDTITLNSVTYRVGEKFTTGSTYTLTGTGFASLYNASTVDPLGNISPHYFLMNYNAQNAITQLEIFMAQNNCNCDGILGETLCIVEDKMRAIQDNFSGDYNLDISGTQTMLAEIITILTSVSNNIPNATF